MFNCSDNRGFTLPELIVSMAVILTIFAFAGINLLRIIPDASLSEVFNSFMADSKAQQNSAMLGESAGVSQIDYSIRIDQNSYTLFKGQVYSPSDPGNYVVTYPNDITASTTFPDSQIVFSAMSGEVKNYSDSTNQVVFNGLYGSHVTIMFNKFGNIYYVNRI